MTKKTTGGMSRENTLVPWDGVGIPKSEYIGPRELLRHYVDDYKLAWAAMVKADLDLSDAAAGVQRVMMAWEGHGD